MEHEGYNLLFWAELERDGHEIRLEIEKYGKWPLDAEGNLPNIAKKIHGLSGLHLSVNEGQERIIAPVAKSSLTFSIPDFPDKPDTVSPSGIITKWGRWEEFYITGAHTLKVRLRQDGKIRWAGYVTPDSYEEDLAYGSSVSVVCRDMLGHMYDLGFDAPGDDSGMLAVGKIIERGLEKAGAIMGVNWNNVYTHISGKDKAADAAGVGLLELAVNVENFKGKTWGEAVESVLSSCGLILRYADNSELSLTDIRGLNSFNIDLTEVGERKKKKALFVGGTGHRSLEPAVRRLVTTSVYNKGDEFEVFVFDNSNTKKINVIDNGLNKQKYLPLPKTGWSLHGNISVYSSGELDPFLSSMLGKRPLLIQAYSSISYDNYMVKRIARGGGYTLEFSYTLHAALGRQEPVNNMLLTKRKCYQPVTFMWRVVANMAGSSKKYYDPQYASWSDTPKTISNVINRPEGNHEDLSANISYKIFVPENAGSVDVVLYGAHIPEAFDLCYCILQDFRISDAVEYDKFITSTIYNDENNIELSFEPDIVQVPDTASHKIITNGLYMPAVGHPSAVKFLMGGNESNLADLIHRQVLQYYSRPNNALTGELYDGDTNDPHFCDIWLWGEGNAKHLLQAGALNLLTGRVEGAVLRQFLEFDELWD